MNAIDALFPLSESEELGESDLSKGHVRTAIHNPYTSTTPASIEQGVIAHYAPSQAPAISSFASDMKHGPRSLRFFNWPNGIMKGHTMKNLQVEGDCAQEDDYEGHRARCGAGTRSVLAEHLAAPRFSNQFPPAPVPTAD